MNTERSTARRGGVPATLGVIALSLLGCGGGESGTGGGHGGSTSQSTGASSTGTTSPGGCDPDPLHTGLTAEQTGVSVDAFDCQVLTWTAKYNEPDAMIFKAIIYVESRFDDTSVACPNLPCGTPSGWNMMEAGCLGLMQIVPACNGTPGNVGMLANG